MIKPFVATLLCASVVASDVMASDTVEPGVPPAAAESASPFSIASKNIEFFCDYADDAAPADIVAFATNAQAEAEIARILAPTGLAMNFAVHPANVSNAAALIGPDKRRYIVYSAEFMNRVRKKTGTDWAALSIMAHELGHHLQGHTTQGTGSRPTQELEADYWSGFVLAKLGANMEQAQVAMRAMGSDAASNTHPPKVDRLAAIAAGWEKGDSKTGAIRTDGVQPPPPPIPTAPQVQAPAVPNETYDTRCFFPSEPAITYLVSTENRIVGIGPNGVKIPVAQRTRPTVPYCSWMYTGISLPAQYCVVPGGQVLLPTPQGMMQVGQCVAANGP